MLRTLHSTGVGRLFQGCLFQGSTRAAWRTAGCSHRVRCEALAWALVLLSGSAPTYIPQHCQKSFPKNVI